MFGPRTTPPRRDGSDGRPSAREDWSVFVILLIIVVMGLYEMVADIITK